MSQAHEELDAGADSPAFVREGQAFVPTRFACSPWSEARQHGAVMLGLLARAVELHPSAQPVQVTRLTVDLMRAAPMAPVETHCRAIRAGRWVETLQASLTAGGAEYARATAMRFRVHALDTSALRAPDERRAERFADRQVLGPRNLRFFARCVDTCAGRGAHGPMIWYRMRVPLVEGEPTTPLQHAAAMADFAYGTPYVLRARREPGFHPDRHFTTINPDTTLNLLRAPLGGWIGLEAQLSLGDEGAGVAQATLWDADGVAGCVSQSILARPLSAGRRDAWRSTRGRGG